MAGNHLTILTEGQKGGGWLCVIPGFNSMNYTYLSWSSAAIFQAKKTMNYEESAGVCNTVSKCLKKQVGKKAYFHLLLALVSFLIISE